jgi:uncharacterized protein YkwD
MKLSRTAALLAAFLAATPLPPVRAESPGPTGGADSAVAAALAEVNRLRAEAGADALRLDARLAAAAQAHAADMAAKGYLAHTSPDGRTLEQRASAAGYHPFMALGENIAQGQADWRAAIVTWMASPGHRANLLDARFEDTGFGAADEYWVQVFGAQD